MIDTIGDIIYWVAATAGLMVAVKILIWGFFRSFSRPKQTETESDNARAFRIENTCNVARMAGGTQEDIDRRILQWLDLDDFLWLNVSRATIKRKKAMDQKAGQHA